MDIFERATGKIEVQLHAHELYTLNALLSELYELWYSLGDSLDRRRLNALCRKLANALAELEKKTCCDVL
jgi:hypothetical protein